MRGGDSGAAERPDEKFAQAQAALAGGGEPELEFGGAKGDDVAVAENLRFERLAVDGGQGVRRDRKLETFPPAEFQREVLVPDAVVIELQIIFRRAPDAERKMADNRLAARLFPERTLS